MFLPAIPPLYFVLSLQMRGTEGFRAPNPITMKNRELKEAIGIIIVVFSDAAVFRISTD